MKRLAAGDFDGFTRRERENVPPLPTTKLVSGKPSVYLCVYVCMYVCVCMFRMDGWMDVHLASA
jgi:hypothetical protein